MAISQPKINTTMAAIKFGAQEEIVRKDFVRRKSHLDNSRSFIFSFRFIQFFWNEVIHGDRPALGRLLIRLVA